MSSDSIKLVREDGAQKTISPWALDDCLAIGWKRADAQTSGNNSGQAFDRDAAIALLKEKNISHHHNAGEAKLKELLDANGLTLEPQE